MLKQTYNLYPEITPYHSDWLQVSPVHHMYYEQSGNPDGQPAVFLHGGPGSGCNPAQRRFFDAAHYRIILLDQRGCGKSQPLGCIEDNTTAHLVEDIEQLRKHLDIDRWLVFGGSWGSTLALAYALAHPQQVSSLVLRGIFLSRDSELDWFLGEVRRFSPEAWQQLSDFIPAAKGEDVLLSYAKRIFSEDRAVSIPAAIRWNAYEGSIMTLRPQEARGSEVGDDIQLARARIQIHYIMNKCFVGQRDLLTEVRNLAGIPTTIVQGRYDMVCPPISAWELHQAMPHAQLEIIADAGHSAMEPGTTSALIAATEAYKSLG